MEPPVLFRIHFQFVACIQQLIRPLDLKFSMHRNFSAFISHLQRLYGPLNCIRVRDFKLIYQFWRRPMMGWVPFRWASRGMLLDCPGHWIKKKQILKQFIFLWLIRFPIQLLRICLTIIDWRPCCHVPCCQTCWFQSVQCISIESLINSTFNEAVSNQFNATWISLPI